MEKWITIGGSLCQEALWGHKIYGLSVREDFSWSPAGFLPWTCPSYHSPGFTHLRSFSSAHLVPGSVGEAGAGQAVSLLSGGLEIGWGGKIHFGTGWTTKGLMDLGLILMEFAKLKGNSGTESYLQIRVPYLQCLYCWCHLLRMG